MSDAVGVKNSTTTWEAPRVKPLDEAVWQAWKVKGRARDRKGRETRIKALKWGSTVMLLAVAALWSQLTPHEIVIRCVLAAAAVGMMIEAFNKRQYAFGAVFAGLVLFYNPVAPVFTIRATPMSGSVSDSTGRCGGCTLLQLACSGQCSNT